MHYSHVLAATAAVASSALAAPASVAGGFEAGVTLGPLSVEVGAAAAADLTLCHGAHAGLAVSAHAKVGCNFHSVDFRARMDTPAHRRYEEALEIYHDVMHLIKHTLMTRGKERALRLIEIAALIRDGEEILIVAGVLNSKDKRKLRRKWIQHEINSLESKFKRARFWAMHLPNLYLAEDFFHFVIDTSVKVVEFAVAVPIVVGAAIGVAIYEAAHLVARAFHFMGHVLHWAIGEIEFAFIMFAKKVKKGLKAIGKGIKKGLKAIAHLGHEIKEGLEDGVAIIVDIGHHAFHHHHHCHSKCNTGLVVADSSSSSSSDEDACDCKEAENFSTITAVCVESEQVCTKEQFTATLSSNYNVQLAWTKEESHEKVKTTLVEISTAMTAFNTDILKIESDAAADTAETAEES